jgi:uncharacterized protein
MRTGPSVIGILIFLGILLLIDVYVFQGIKTLTSTAEARTRKIIHLLYWFINISLFVWFIILLLTFKQDGSGTRVFMAFMGVWVLLFIPKLVFTTVLLGEDIYRLFRGAYGLGHNALSEDKIALSESRRKFVSGIGLLLAAVPFVGSIHGLVAGKFRFTVRRVTLETPDLPDAFDGFTITQLSDIHVGSFDPEGHREEVIRAIDLANKQGSDLFVFTGDLVNNLSSEMDPWMDVFSKLKAPYGQFSILGNHDYGDYVQWPSKEAKKANLDRLIGIHEQVGFKILLNEHVMLEKAGQQIALIGVEDWGKGFKTEGDIDKALIGVPDNMFKLLLSHDPSHFDEIISKHDTHIHLTLSGHTHGMQFGIEIPGIKFSPVQFRYPHWAGFYKENERHLYVNRGFGFLGFPGRVGIWPEITVITLRKKMA